MSEQANSIFDLLCHHNCFWRQYPMDMKARVISHNKRHFALLGMCPHCGTPTSFLVVVEPYFHQGESWAVLQCQGCGNFICGCVKRSGEQSDDAHYHVHYPLGKPSDNVAAEIPAHIADDFREALRCRWVDAFNATTEMCRRAVQAACLHLQAPSKKKLIEQIDWLASKGTITTPLQEMAHRIRLGGNLGAHPPKGGPTDPKAIVINDEYADAVIEFTRDFFQHVFVMPIRLAKYKF